MMLRYYGMNPPSRHGRGRTLSLVDTRGDSRTRSNSSNRRTTTTLRAGGEYRSELEEEEEGEDEGALSSIQQEPVSAEVFDEEATRRYQERVIADAWERGRQAALQGLQHQLLLLSSSAVAGARPPANTTVQGVVYPGRTARRGLVYQKHTVVHRTSVAVVVAVMLIAVLAVIPVVVVRSGTASAGTITANSNASSTGSGSLRCFVKHDTLQDGVDAYLQSPQNNTFNHEYGYPIGTWCVSYVLRFDDLFNAERNVAASFFDEDLSGWDVSRARSMTGMFANARHFHGYGLDNWTVSTVRSMSGMFDGACSFNANLSRWDVSRVTSMGYMFGNASTFRGTGLDRWDVSKVHDAVAMFYGASSLEVNLSNWSHRKPLFQYWLEGS